MTHSTDVPADLRRAFREAADPTRWRIYKFLGFLGAMKVGSLARIVGVSDALMRRHLEAMAEVGLVEPVNEGRERRWQQVLTEGRDEPTGLRVDPSDAYAAALFASREFSEWLKVVVETGAGIVTEFIDQRMEVEPEWRDATEVQDYILFLTRGELDALSRDLQALIRERLPKSRDRLEARDPEARPVYVSTHAVLWPQAEER